MKRIEILPKFYSLEELDERSKQMQEAKEELLKTELSENGRKNLEDLTVNLRLVKDTYSRNYEIKKMNSFLILKGFV